MTGRRQAILVLGMHRSGTSAVAGMLADYGASLPADLMAAQPMNPKGFAESESISRLDDELMRSLGSSWFDWRPFAADPAVREMDDDVARAVALERAAFGDQDLVVLKDPRICRLVPFWQEVMRRAEREVLYLHVHRDPSEVAASLDRWAGYGTAYGELLWLRYVLDAEAATRGTTRAFVGYDQVLRSPQTVARRLGQLFSLEWPTAVAEQGSFVEASLRRSHTSVDEPPSPWCEAALRVVEEWSVHGENALQHRQLDALRTALDEATPGFARVVDQGREFDIRLRRQAQEQEDAHP